MSKRKINIFGDSYDENLEDSDVLDLSDVPKDSDVVLEQPDPDFSGQQVVDLLGILKAKSENSSSQSEQVTVPISSTKTTKENERVKQENKNENDSNTAEDKDLNIISKIIVPFKRDKLIFLDGNDAKNYDCGICLDTVSDLRDCGEGHFFCQLCIKDWKTCPICRTNTLKWQENKFAQRQVDNLKVECDKRTITLKEYRQQIKIKCCFCKHISTTDEDLYQHFSSHLSVNTKFHCPCPDATQNKHNAFCTKSTWFGGWVPRTKVKIGIFDIIKLLKARDSCEKPDFYSDSVVYTSSKMHIDVRLLITKTDLRFSVIMNKGMYDYIGRFVWKSEDGQITIEEPLQYVQDYRAAVFKCTLRLPKIVELWFYSSIQE